MDCLASLPIIDFFSLSVIPGFLPPACCRCMAKNRNGMCPSSTASGQKPKPVM